jgi:hypothetical protein
MAAERWQNGGVDIQNRSTDRVQAVEYGSRQENSPFRYRGVPLSTMVAD